MTIRALLDVDVGSFALDGVEIDVDAGETVALLGPNGAGKSTALRAIAGLTPLTAGRVEIGAEVVDEPAHRTFKPPEQRSVGVVFQDLLLFPHLSVVENVAFGLRAHGVPAREARGASGDWLERLGVGEHAGARPRQLSGGQAQRVALARALAVEPKVLLLDEPLTALDATTRPEIRRLLARHLDSFAGATLIVTHDPFEAMALADRLIVLEEGRVTQAGTPAQIRERPRTRYAADIAGVNLYRGTATSDGLVLDSGTVIVSATRLDGPALAVVHPRAVALHRARPEGTPRNVWQGRVEHIDPEGERARVHVSAPVPITAEVTAASVGELELAEGSEVWVSVKATEVALSPA